MIEIFLASLRLGLISFGGPVAHLAYFHREYVVRRRWLDEADFADLVALCQALPGPASSQIGMAIGQRRGGPLGALVAWLGFTLPSALLMVAFAAFWTEARGSLPMIGGLVHGLGLVALAVVAQAVWLLGRKLITGPGHAALAVGALVVLALAPSVWTPPAVLVAAALGGLVLFRTQPSPPADSPSRFRRGPALWCLGLFFGLLVLLPALRWVAPTQDWLVVADGFYRTGALVFGGGHVVLPLLQNEVVAPGFVTSEAFLAGYGVVQAVPGPLFTFSGYLGFLIGGVPGALVALVAVFLPSLLLVWGVLPLWGRLKTLGWFGRALEGVNAAVVGLLAWAWYDPVLIGSVRGPVDLVLGGGLLALLVIRTPPWVVVLVGAAAGLGLQAA